MPENSAHRVVVTDIDMPFFSMVLFMVKWAIAAIPAMLILGALALALSVVIAGLFTGFTGLRTMSVLDDITTPSSAKREITTLPSEGGMRAGVKITPECAWPYGVNEPNALSTCQMFYNWSPEERDRIVRERQTQ